MAQLLSRPAKAVKITRSPAVLIIEPKVSSKSQRPNGSSKNQQPKRPSKIQRPKKTKAKAKAKASAGRKMIARRGK
jgi:hypothetical protein